MAWHVVIAGGGFGGFYAARALERAMPAAEHADHARQRRQLHALHAAAARRRGGHARAAPRRRARCARRSSGPTCASGRSPARDPDRNVAAASRSIEGRDEELAYDHLVVALGSISRTLPVPGLAEHALGFKSLPDAIELRNRVLRTLEAAETLEDPAEREAWLTYVFVGAGYAGLEGLAELQDFAARRDRPLPALPHRRGCAGSSSRRPTA